MLQHCVRSHVFTLVALATTEQTKQLSPWKQQCRDSEWSNREVWWHNRELQGNCSCLRVCDWGLHVCVHRVWLNKRTARTRSASVSHLFSQAGKWSDIGCCVSFCLCSHKHHWPLVSMLSCCSSPVLRLMTEWELRRGTALSLSLPLQWTQSQSFTATPRRKVCLFVTLHASFLFSLLHFYSL